MSVFDRPGPRFIAEAIAIVLAAAIPGVLHLVWWEIGACVVVVLLLAVWIESSMGAPAPAPRPAAEPVQLPPVTEESPRVRVLQHERPLAELIANPVPVPLPEPEPEPEPEPARAAVAAPVHVTGPPFNVGELASALDASGSATDEQTFLLQYLRDYAGADGTLPPEFDELVRESFGALL